MTMEHGEDCCVKVAVHVRPLIGDEKLQGCKDCVAVVPGKPQVWNWTADCFFLVGCDGFCFLACVFPVYLVVCMTQFKDFALPCFCALFFLLIGPPALVFSDYLSAMHGSLQAVN